MKTQLKILTAILATIFMTSPINANMLDDKLERQCQFQVYGNGEVDIMNGMYLLGLVSGMKYMTLDRTEFASNTNYGAQTDKACENALNNITAYGFEDDFKREVMKLQSEQYAD